MFQVEIQKNWLQLPEYAPSTVYANDKQNRLASWVEMPQTEDGTSKEMRPTRQQEILGIQRGLLFPYVGKKLEVYHCPQDKRFLFDKRVDLGGYRTYSIAGCMDGFYVKDQKVVKRFSQIPIPSQKYVFVEEFWKSDTDGYGWNSQGWQLNPFEDKWIDPVSVVHGNKSVLGFADGHGEPIRWKDKQTIAFAKDKGKAKDTNRDLIDNPDLKYMQAHWTVVK
jgi:prepilin-type processing-associated H-X9-DG protein